ncbi:MAG: ATP-binding protein, partial [Polyangia bacterium]
RKAQATGAIPQALGLLGHAVALAGVHGWSESYRLTFAAKMAEAECEYLRGDNERTLALLDEIDARAADVLDRARGKNLRTMVLVRLGRPLDGCANSVAALRQLGVDLPELSDRELIEQSLHAEFVVLQPELAAAPLSELPEMSEPIQLARVQALAHAIPPAYQSVPPLMALMVFKAMRIMLRHGANDLLPFFLAQYAIANLVITEDHVAAHRLGKLAIAVGQGRKNTGTLGSVYFLCAAFVAYWCEPIADVIDLFEQGTQRCLETGDLLHATFCATLGTAHRQQAGRPLAEVRAAIARARELIERSGDRLNRQHLALRDRLAVVLADGSETPGSLDGGGFSEAEFLASVPEAYQPWLRAAQVVLRFHAGMHDEVLAAAAGHVANTGLPYVFDLALYAGLAHAALARAAQAEDRARHLEGLAEKASTFAAWARLCPANCAHRHALLAAELAELRGDTLAALTEYDRAITGAREHGFLQDLALAYELGGACHWRGLRISSALTFLRDAVRAYRAWGAGAKVHLLQECYPDLASGSSKGDEELAAIARQATDTASKRASTGHGRTGAVALDMESAMRAAQAIAGQLSSDKLLERLMRILAENAGAQRAVLLVPRDDDLYAEAERTINPDVVQVGMGKAVAQAVVPEKMIRYVARSHEAAVWNNGLADPTSLSDDAYLGAAGPRSALCVPLLHQGQLGAVLYLENHALTGGFNPARVSRIQFLAAQAASALANSRLYEEVNAARRDLEIRVCERTRELRQRNTDLRNVLDTVNQGLVTIDRFARVSGESSARAKSWFGALENGRSWIEVLADVDAAYAEQFQSFFTRLAQGEPLAKLRAEMPRKLAARERALELDLSPVGSEEGWQHMLVVASDITDRERQAHLEMELRQAQKLQAVGELAAGIAHEINTPAQFVGDSVDFISGVFKQMLELLGQYRKASKECSPSTLAELADAEDRADMAYNEENAPAALARATDGISRIATIVRAMKEFAHPDSREKTTADLNRALLTTLTIARNEYKYVAEADTALSPLPPVLCHVGDLNQVFLNIIVNAAHAIADVVGKSGGKGRITVRTFAAGDRVRIEITDTGCGILPEIRDRVYDPFFTTKEVGRGSGQGLAIARNIVVNQHGGQLSFTSEVGQGTTFIIELPVG